MQLPLQLLGRQRPGDGGAAGVEHGVSAQLALPPLGGAARAGVHPVEEGEDEVGQPQLQLGEQRQQHGPQQHLEQQRPRPQRRRRPAGTGLWRQQRDVPSDVGPAAARPPPAPRGAHLPAASRALGGLRSRGLSRRLRGARGDGDSAATSGPELRQAPLHGGHGRAAPARERGKGRAATVMPRREGGAMCGHTSRAAVAGKGAALRAGRGWWAVMVVRYRRFGRLRKLNFRGCRPQHRAAQTDCYFHLSRRDSRACPLTLENIWEACFLPSSLPSFPLFPFLLSSPSPLLYTPRLNLKDECQHPNRKGKGTSKTSDNQSTQREDAMLAAVVTAALH